MKTYKVNANYHVNVITYVEAEDEDQARKLAKTNIFNKELELQDPIEDPKINWVELEDDDSEPDYQCGFCGQESCDCDML
jgi:DNA-dependent RNA polymerase auxiliary subunit epsilon